jgi:hypothetical protein
MTPTTTLLTWRRPVREKNESTGEDERIQDGPPATDRPGKEAHLSPTARGADEEVSPPPVAKETL